MRIVFLPILSIICFQSFSQLAEVDWISPTPHGYKFQHITTGLSSNYYAIGPGGHFFELDANFNVVNRSAIGQTRKNLFEVNRKLIHAVSENVIYLAFKENTNISAPVEHLISTDAGKTWNPSSLKFLHFKAFGDTAFGITSTGFYSSFDGGQNWHLNWQSDSLNVFDIVGDTVLYVRAQKELRMQYGTTDSLLVDFVTTFSAPFPNYSLSEVWGLNYVSAKTGILRLVNGSLVKIDHRKNQIDTLYYDPAATLHYMGNYNYYSFKYDGISIYTDTLKTVTHHTTAVNFNHRMVAPSDSGALVSYAHQHNGDYEYRYGFLDFSNWSITDIVDYHFPGRIGEIYQKRNADILTFTDDNIHLWENASCDISHFKSSTPPIKLGRYFDDKFGMLLTSGDSAAAFSSDEGDSWQDIRSSQSPPGFIRIQSSTEFVGISDYASSFSYGPPHNIQLIYSLDQGQTWNQSMVMASSQGMRDAWIFDTDSALGISSSNVPKMYTLPDLSSYVEVRTTPNWNLLEMQFLSDGSLLAATEDGFYISRDNARSWEPRAPAFTSIEPGFSYLQFSKNGMLYMWNRDSSELIFSQDTGRTMSRIKFMPHGLIPQAGQKGDLFFAYGNRLAVYKVANSISVDDWFRPEINFAIYPNPAKNKVQLKLPESFANSRIEVFNLGGQLQLSLPSGSLTAEINVSGFPPGVYVVKISKGSESISKKLLVLR